MTLSVIIITYERPLLLRRCLESLKKQITLPDQVIVVDSSSTPLPEEDVRALPLGERIVYEKSEKRLTQPQARNRGLKKVSTDIVAFLEDDAFAHDTWIKTLREVFEKEDTYAGVTGPTIDSDRDGTPLFSIIRDTKKRIRILPWGEVRSSARRWIPSHPVVVDAMQGANMSFRTSDIQNVGGFDENYILPAFREETDMALTLTRKTGKKYLYHPDVFVAHMPEQKGGITDVEENKKEYFFHAGENQRYFADKFFSPLLTRVSWIFFSRNPPALLLLPLLFLMGRKGEFAWHKGLWKKRS